MYQLRKSSKQDIEQIANCQLACFEKSFSTKLGQSYTAKTLQWFLTGENRFLFHVVEGETVVGFCGGFISRQPGDGSTSGMMQYAMREAAIGMIGKPWLFFSKEIRPFYPLIIKNISNKIFRKKNLLQKSIPTDQPFEKKVGLVVIGVLPRFRGKGVFEMLMTAFENETVERNIQRMGLSVKKDNQHAIHAYEKCGWQVNKEHAGSYEMYKEIS